MLGFVSYYQGFIPALFVSQEIQSNDLGHTHLDFLKNRQSRLNLAVYEEILMAWTSKTSPNISSLKKWREVNPPPENALTFLPFLGYTYHQTIDPNAGELF